MKKRTIINDLDALKAIALKDWETFQKSFTDYLDEYDKTQLYLNVSCGDDRFSIIESVYKLLTENAKLVFPEEVDQATMASEIVEYSGFLKFSDNFGDLNNRLSESKVHLGASLGNKLQIISKYLVYKASNNSEYQKASDLALSYFDPAEKRKQTNLDKKRNKRNDDKKDKGSDKA